MREESSEYNTYWSLLFLTCKKTVKLVITKANKIVILTKLIQLNFLQYILTHLYIICILREYKSSLNQRLKSQNTIKLIKKNSLNI